MLVAKTKAELKDIISKFKESNKTISFVPTMGALHAGHMSLVDIAQKNADIVVASIFVNPAQFAEGEDFYKYPRTIEDDTKELEARGVHVAYLPSMEDMYPDGFCFKISTGDIGQQLEGVTRPFFFDGVALVVTKLFMQVQPDVAVFGQKDFQQLYIIKRLVAQLDIPVKILGGEIMREASGLAMSSRNRYLSSEKKKIAANLYRVMEEIAAKIKSGSSFYEALNWGTGELLKAGFKKVDYLEVRDPNSLVVADCLPARLLAAVYLDDVRLIDNLEIK